MQRKKCQPVTYTGCKYSDNIFVSLKSCITKCHLYVEMDREEYQPGTLPISCIFPKYAGRCKASFPNYYYNTETKACEEFIFGGCGGNPNNFGTIEDCIEECQCSGEGCQITVRTKDNLYLWQEIKGDLPFCLTLFMYFHSNSSVAIIFSLHNRRGLGDLQQAGHFYIGMS